MITDPFTQQFTIEDMLGAIRITWQGKKDMGGILTAGIWFLYNLFLIGLLAYFIQAGGFNFGPSQEVTLIMFILFAVVIMRAMYKRVIRLMEVLLNHEVIQIDSLGVTVERSGFLNIENKVVYPAERISSIRIAITGYARSLGLNFAPGGGFLIRFKLGGNQTFCRGISEADAAAALAKIQERFPQYREIKS